MATHRASRRLPTWDEMSPEDQSSAIDYVKRLDSDLWSRSSRRMFSCRYLDDPRLSALSWRRANRHAKRVTGGFHAIRAKYAEQKRIAEFSKITYLALRASERTRIERIEAARRSGRAPRTLAAH